MTRHHRSRSHSPEHQSLSHDLERAQANYQAIINRAQRELSPPSTPRLTAYQSSEAIDEAAATMTPMHDAHRGKRRGAEMEVDKCSISCTLV